MLPKSGIEIAVIYNDVDLVKVRVRASNGIFSGQADAYARLGELKILAAALKGFPTSARDIRTFEIGTFDSNYAGGGARFRFFCADSIGHAMVEVRLRSDLPTRSDDRDTAAFQVPVEANAIDEFVKYLNRISDSVGESAFLNSVD